MYIFYESQVNFNYLYPLNYYEGSFNYTEIGWMVILSEAKRASMTFTSWDLHPM
jgi:hypothetical protein